MSKDKIWLSSPHMGGEEIKYIQEAFDSNWVAPLGPNVNEFENLIEHYLGDNVHVAALSSGTAAIHLALILLGVKRGDDVICQSFTFAASANPIIYQGANPIFVDSEIDTWNMCPKLLEECIIDRISSGEKPKAIIAVHLYGMPFKADEIFNAQFFSSEVVVPLYEYCDFSISMIEAFIISKFFILRFVRSIETVDILYEFISLRAALRFFSNP